MNFRIVLLGIILVELVVGGFRLYSRWQQPKVVIVDYSMVHPVTADDLKESVQSCKSPEDWRSLGELYMATGFFTEAEMAHRVACELSPLNATYRFQWAFALERLGMLNEANEQYQRAIQANYPKPNAARYYMARNFLRLEQLDDAERLFEQAQEIPMSKYEFARIAYRKKDQQKLNTLLNSSLEQHPDLLEPNLLRYRVAADEGNLRDEYRWSDRMKYSTGKLPNPFDEDSERLMKRFNSTGIAKRWSVCTQLVNSRKFDEAEKLIKQTIALDWHPNGADLLAEIEFERSSNVNTVTLLADAITREGPSGHLLGRLADAYQQTNQPKLALATWKRALPLIAPSERDKMAQSMAYAANQLNDAAEVARCEAETALIGGCKLMQRREWSKAERAFEAGIKRDPNRPELWFFLGESQRWNGNSVSAKASYEECLKRAPLHGEAARAIQMLTQK